LLRAPRVVLAWGVALAAALPALACELVIGDAPSNKSKPDGGEGETSGLAGGVTGSGGMPAAGGTVSGGGKGAAGGTIPANGGREQGGASQGGASQGGHSQGGSPGIFDAGANNDGGNAGSSMEDAAPPGTGGSNAVVPCTSPVLWYQDNDGDGYGVDDITMFTCPKPATGKWSRVGGDCNDAGAAASSVHPGQQKYSGTPYQRADNTDSYDYDCSGMEDANPQLQPAPQSCGALQLLLCGNASGYEPTTRAGPGINPYCGSQTVLVCIPGLAVCGNSERTNQPAFSCR
jgi:hypothetical protein